MSEQEARELCQRWIVYKSFFWMIRYQPWLVCDMVDGDTGQLVMANASHFSVGGNTSGDARQCLGLTDPQRAAALHERKSGFIVEVFHKAMAVYKWWSDMQPDNDGHLPCGSLTIGRVPGNDSSGHIATSKRRCEWCELVFQSKLKVCAGCKKVRYCTRFCQKEDWEVHKHDCIPYDVIGKLAGAGSDGEAFRVPVVSLGSNGVLSFGGHRMPTEGAGDRSSMGQASGTFDEPSTALFLSQGRAYEFLMARMARMQQS